MKMVLFVLIILMINGLKGQDRIFTGSIINSRNQPLQGVSVITRYPESTKIFAFSISGKDGSFRISDIPPNQKSMIIEFRHISFEPKTISIDSVGDVLPTDLIIQLQEKTTVMKEIVIKREVPVLIRSDTVVFNASSYRDAEVRKVEDLLRKMQGFSVDPNGKLIFNGKPVEKVLIDGEDLAGKAYQMITRNLDALTIDKVEVINNFSDNRLLRNVTESNKVGVNLRISSTFKSKMSGGIEAGLSFEQRYNADFNTIYLEKRFKWLVFGNYNNTAKDPSGNARYSFQQEGGQISNVENSDQGSMILEPGSFVMPSINDRYTRENNDLGLAVMNSWKIGEYIRVNGMLGFNDLSSRNKAKSLELTEISDLERWIVNNELGVHKSGNDLGARMSLQKDKGKKHVSRIDLSLNGGRQREGFSNFTNGSFSDSLREKLNNRLKEIRLGWQETFLLGKNVLQLNFNIEHGNYEQELQISSSRYLSYWQIDSSYISNFQALKHRSEYYQVLIKLNGKKDLIQYEYGIRSEYRLHHYFSDALIRSSAAKPDFEIGDLSSELRDLTIKGMFSFGIATGKKGWVGVSGETGWELLTARSEHNNFINFNAGIGYSKRFSLLNSFRVNYRLNRGFKDYHRFYPDELMSGNGMILNGMNFKSPEFSHGVVASLNANNINRQRNWSFNFSFMMMPKRYTTGVEAYPEYSQHYFELNDHNSLLNMGANWEGFIRAIRGKLGGLVRANAARYASTVNFKRGSSTRSGMQIEGWWVSGFPAPVNAELRGALNYTAGSWDQGELNRNWQYRWSSKLKIKPGGSLYFAWVWNVHRVTQKSLFHEMDLFASFKLSPALLLTLTGTNLFNAGRFVDRTVMPYSTSATQFAVVGRYLLFSLTWNF